MVSGVELIFNHNCFSVCGGSFYICFICTNTDFSVIRLQLESKYSCKPVKALINYEKQRYYMYSQAATIPLLYGTQPNLGVYFQPDGPFPNDTE